MWLKTCGAVRVEHAELNNNNNFKKWLVYLKPWSIQMLPISKTTSLLPLSTTSIPTLIYIFLILYWKWSKNIPFHILPIFSMLTSFKRKSSRRNCKFSPFSIFIILLKNLCFIKSGKRINLLSHENIFHQIVWDAIILQVSFVLIDKHENILVDWGDKRMYKKLFFMLYIFHIFFKNDSKSFL